MLRIHNAVLMVLAICLGLTCSAQSILVNPYLQNATPVSIHIMWETNTNTESVVDFGLTMDLGTAISGVAFTSLGSTIHHDVLLTGLHPGTRYYYQAITGAWKSPIWSFVTPPLHSAEAGFNIALMSDMQIDNGNPTIFGDLINTSLLPYINNTYGSPLNAHLQMVMIPGDLVDNGNVFSQWKNHYFNPAEALWREVPSYPAIGNHEANSPNYFKYFNLPLNGTPGYYEHWYAVDYSNVRVLGMDSNGPYRIAAQLDWLDSMLVLSCQDTFIDFVFAQMHHPHKSELWTPGEIDYTGDIIERMEAFSDSCGKPTIHFFGHTHAYSRGESQDHQHLWINVATAGGNIDYWGEFENADYEEFVISEDAYGYVIVEVTAGENPQLVVRRLSYGDEFDSGGSTETDALVVRKNNAVPATPLALFPLQGDTVSPVCVTIAADAFVDPDGDLQGSSQWQISTDSSDFSNPVEDHWEQYQNWYNEVDLQAGDALTDESFNSLAPGETYWWRVRYRDRSLGWSEWTTPVRFSTHDVTTLTGNLVQNPGAESGIGSWIIDQGTIESLAALECSGINPYAGIRYFAVGALCTEHAFASVHQDLSVSTHAALIDASEVLVHYGAYLADWQNTDIPSFALEFLDGSGNVISGTDTIAHQQSTWTLKESTVPVPPLTRTIRFILMGTRTAGADNDSYFDQIFASLLLGNMACSMYEPPGPPAGRLYVDHSAQGVPNGESWLKAYQNVGDAIRESNTNPLIREIWIADGTYPVTTTINRDTTFLITRKVKVYGGFAGTEASLDERNPAMYAVTLSGETGNPGTLSDNVYHVVTIANTMDTVLLDGLQISGGYADVDIDSSGGGVVIEETAMGLSILQHCTLESNHALSGSAVHNRAQLELRQCTIPSSENVSLVLNSGPLAHLLLDGTDIEQCIGCPEAILNRNNATLNMIHTNLIERN